MKKSILFASAAIAALAFTSCSNEVDMFQSVQSEKGYIALNVDATEPISVSATRGTVSASATDWYVKLNNGSQMTVASIAGKAFNASTNNTLTVYNYTSMETALATNSGRGAAYWTGTSASFDIEAGKTANVSVNCGTAKNAAFSVVFNSTFTAVAATGYKVTASTGSGDAKRSLVFDASNSTTAYYESGTLTYTLEASVNGKNVEVSKDVTLTAGTNTQLTVKSNTNGTINLTITYTDFTTDTTNEVTIDAATGAEV